MNIFIVVSLVRLTIIFYYSLSRITNGEFHSLYDTELTRSLWCSFVYEAVRAIWPNFDHIYIENSFSRRRRMSRRGERSIDRVSSRAFVMQPHSAKRVANRLTRDTCIIYMERGMEYLFGNARFQRFESLLYEEHTSWSITRNWCMERVRNCLLSFRTEFPFHQKIAKEILFRMHNVQIRSKEEES